MQELLDKALLTLWGIWRFKWTALLFAWLIAAMGWLVVSQMEYRYRAEAQIFVDSNSVLEPLLYGIAVQPDVHQRVELMSRALLTRPNLEKLVRVNNMDVEVGTGQRYDQLLSHLRSRISIWGGGHANSIYYIAYEDKDPVLSKEVVQSLISIFIESNLGEERQDSSAAQAFLETQISDYESRLVDAETRLSNFKRDNVGSMPNQAGGYYERLQRSQVLARETNLALREARTRQNELEKIFENEAPTLFSESNAPSSKQLRLKGLQEELDEILVRFTEKHPQVAQLRDNITTVEKEIAESLEVAKNNPRELRGQPNAYFQELKGMLAVAKGRVAELEVRAADYQRQIAELNSTVDSIPQVEARLQQLDRDYETVKAQHETLLQKLESAKLSESLENNAEDVKFRVIDPPVVPSQPSSPNKLALYSAVFALSIAAGVAIAFFLSFMRPVYYSQKGLMQVSKLPVIGSVTLVNTGTGKFINSISVVTYVSALIALFLVFTIVAIVEIKDVSVSQLASMSGLDFINQLINSKHFDVIANSELLVRIKDLVRKL